MKYCIDHDYHIHTYLSSCSQEPEQTKENILLYAKRNNLKSICLTDHYWDSAVPGASRWYTPQNYDHISKSLPLPCEDGIKYMFGCETDLKSDLTLGIPKERFNDFDFIIIPTTHLHMKGFTVSSDAHEDSAERASLWVKRLDAVLNMDLPFHKIGIAHLACSLTDPRSPENHIKTLSLISREEMERLFTKAASLGCGIEINQSDAQDAMTKSETIFDMFKVAKSCGCKFYLGSDSHSPRGFVDTTKCFEYAIDMLGLTEDDKFHL